MDCIPLEYCYSIIPLVIHVICAHVSLSPCCFHHSREKEIHVPAASRTSWKMSEPKGLICLSGDRKLDWRQENVKREIPSDRNNCFRRVWRKLTAGCSGFVLLGGLALASMTAAAVDVAADDINNWGFVTAIWLLQKEEWEEIPNWWPVSVGCDKICTSDVFHEGNDSYLLKRNISEYFAIPSSLIVISPQFSNSCSGNRRIFAFLKYNA